MPKSTGLKGAGFMFEKDLRICPYCGDPDCVLCEIELPPWGAKRPKVK